MTSLMWPRFIATIGIALALHPAATSSARVVPAERLIASPTASIATSMAAAQDDVPPQAKFRAPLLREGAQIIEAKARMIRDESLGWWKLVIDKADRSAPGYELLLLPCTRLGEMQRLIESSPTNDVVFVVTGYVFVYRNRNYILPQHALVLADESFSQRNKSQADRSSSSAAGVESPTAMPSSAASEAATDAPGTGTAPSGGDTAEDILRSLDEAAGPSMRSTSSPPEAPLNATDNADARGDESTTTSASTDDPSALVPLDDESRTTRSTSARGSLPTEDETAEKLLREETGLVNRRGKITRDSSGAWLFVFDADASGLADPPMRLLPCMLLERIEDYARRMGSNSPMLISGQVYIYNRQNYLLPTVFRVPRERTKLTP